MSENQKGTFELETIYKAIIDNMQDGAYFVDKNRKILFWNKAAETITGYHADEIIGKDCPSSNLSHIDENGTPLCQVGCPLFATNIDGKQRRERVFVRHKDGHRIPLQVNIFPIQQDNDIIGSIEIFTQDSPTKYDDELIEHLSGIAMHDALTKLPNRRYLESFINFKLAQLKRFRQNFAVVFADIDNFSTFNNTYGHEAGDAVLTNIANTFMKNTKKDDMIGRWGGEEFVGVFTLHNENEATIVGEKLRLAVQATEINFNDTTLNVTVSVCVTVAKFDDTIETLVERADLNMYQSKKNGKNRVTAD
ncbi:MAG: GGDEF domain-containing protein [Solobacterium sp.]|nr:GGDEF domain-containing protein [Solobacterium sp.]